MWNLVKVYAPDTGEMFEVNPTKASDLVLNHGWSQQPHDPNGVPAVQNVEVFAEEQVVIDADAEAEYEDDEDEENNQEEE